MTQRRDQVVIELLVQDAGFPELTRRCITGRAGRKAFNALFIAVVNAKRGYWAVGN